MKDSVFVLLGKGGEKMFVTCFADKVVLSDYTAIGDITVTGLSIAMFILLFQTSVHKSRHFNLTLWMITSTLIASYSNILFYTLINEMIMIKPLLYVLRLVHNLALSVILLLYLRYLQDPLWVSQETRKHYNHSTLIMLIGAMIIDITATLTGRGFVIFDEGGCRNGFNVFVVLFLMLTAMIFFITIKYRTRILRQIFIGLLGVNIVSIGIMIMQIRSDQASYTTVCYFFPIIGIIFMFHSNPYDIDTGAVSETYFYSEQDDMIEHKKEFLLMSCNMQGFLQQVKVDKELRAAYSQFFRRNMRKGVLYKFPGDRLLLSLPRDSGTEDTMHTMLTEFAKIYGIFRLDYRIVICRSNSRIASARDYIKLIEYAEMSTPNCGTHIIDENDIKNFYSSDYIVNELLDIAAKRDLDDPRVIVYCQPVYNLITKSYDTAEALMRIKLEQTGMVYPDIFIPLAEQNDCIHMMSLIILNKTCQAVKQMLSAGYDIQRVSVNFSVIDLRYESFCSDVKGIIGANGIPFSKIAVEITESRSDSDFNVMKQRVIELRELGIKFYLDDFGTGYSNFERIMEIPFDIIKFDRSMLIESGRSETGEFMVGTFAGMFKKLNYSVLFEGVEDEHDEQHCIRMQASYLQGYKYSKPIPIDDLRGFLKQSS